jgi:hypothetical protein
MDELFIPMAQKIIDGQLFDTFLVRSDREDKKIPVLLTDEVEIKNDEGHPIPVEPLGIPSIARQLTVTATSASVELSETCTRISMYARQGAIRFRVGTGELTAVATDHFLDANSAMDIRVPPGATLAAIRDSDANATLEISELI